MIRTHDIYTQEEAKQKFLDCGFILDDIYKGNKIKVKLICHCGNLFFSTANMVWRQHTKSCGCRRRKVSSERWKIERLKDITGKKFNQLLVISRNGRGLNHNESLWLCRCDCGRFNTVRQSHLKDTKTCGNCRNLKNGVQISHPQVLLYKMLNKGVLNFKTGSFCVDIALVKNGTKIAIEYDEWYWHKNRLNIDDKKKNYLLTNGWKLLVIKANKNMPTENMILSAIDNLLKDDINYIEIILDNWGN